MDHNAFQLGHHSPSFLAYSKFLRCSHVPWPENVLHSYLQEGALSPVSAHKHVICLLMDWGLLLFTTDGCAVIGVDSLGTENETGAALWSASTTHGFPALPLGLGMRETGL